MPQRILLLHPAPGIPLLGTGGGCRHLQELVRAFVAEGHQVRVLCRRLGPAPTEEEGFLPCHVESFRGPSLASPLRRRPRIDEQIYDWSFLRAARAAVRQFRPTLIYERMSLYSQAGGRLARETGIPLILETNAPLCQERSEFEGLRIGRLEKRLESRILHQATRVITVSRALTTHVRELGVPSGKIVWLPNGVDSDRFRPTEKNEELRRRFGLESGPVIGFTGSFKPWHGVELLLEALRLLAPPHTAGAPKLLLVGDGPQLPLLRSRCQAIGLDHAVRFTGAVPEGLLPSVQATFDIATAPALMRPDYWFCPLKIPEAMAQSLPVVATDQGAHRDYLGPREGRRAGVLIDSDRPEPWAKCLRELLDNPTKRSALGAEGRRRARMELDWRHVVRRVIASALDNAVADEVRPAPYTSARAVEDKSPQP